MQQSVIDKDVKNSLKTCPVTELLLLRKLTMYISLLDTYKMDYKTRLVFIANQAIAALAKQSGLTVS